MKQLYSFSIAALALAICACSSDDEITTLAPQLTTVETTALYAPAFPQPDGSKVLTGNVYKDFNNLIKAIDPERALDYSSLEITDEQFQEIQAAATEQCKGVVSDAEKITALNKWVHNYVTYGESDNNAYAVFQNHMGVCQGFSNLLKAALVSQGIPCVCVNGWYATSSAYYGHAWVYACAISASTGKPVWYICDPTNSTARYSIGSSSSQHLQPEMADIVLFDDDQFEYKWQYRGFNISRVKYGDRNLVLPFSAGGYQLNMFNPEVALPATVNNIYMGSNITSLGESYNIIGLRAYPAQDRMFFVDPENKELGSANGVVYRKNYDGDLTSIYYIPTQMTSITLLPIEKVEKNTILDQPSVEEIIFPDGTKVLESYAIESCPNLRRVYVPKDCTLEKDAIYLCPASVEVIYGIPTGITKVRM